MPFVGLHIGHRDDINTLLNLIVVKGLRFVHMVDANIIIKYNQISNDIKMTQSSGHRGWLEKKNLNEAYAELMKDRAIFDTYKKEIEPQNFENNFENPKIFQFKVILKNICTCWVGCCYWFDVRMNHTPELKVLTFKNLRKSQYYCHIFVRIHIQPNT